MTKQNDHTENVLGYRFFWLFWPHFRLASEGIVHRGRLLLWSDVRKIVVVDMSRDVNLPYFYSIAYTVLKISFKIQTIKVNGLYLHRKNDPWQWWTKGNTDAYRELENQCFDHCDHAKIIHKKSLWLGDGGVSDYN